MLARDRRDAAAAADQDPVAVEARPERAVGERLAEGADDRERLVLEQEVRGKPVGGDAARVEALSYELEVLARVERSDAGHLGRRRLAGDEVVALRGALEEKAAILDVAAYARVAQRVARWIGVDELTHLQDVARDVDDIDRLHLREIGNGARGGSDAE